MERAAALYISNQHRNERVFNPTTKDCHPFGRQSMALRNSYIVMIEDSSIDEISSTSLKPVPAGIILPMMTFSFRPRR